MATAGSIVIDLLMKTGSFSTDTKRAEKRLKEMEKTAKEVGKVIGTAIASGATIATTAIVMWTRDLVVASEEIRRFAQLSNTSTDTFQKWAAGASSVGIQQDKLADILKDMQDRVGDFVQTGGGPMADFFEKIAPKVGVTAEQFRKLSGPDALQLFVSSLEKANVSANDMVFYMEAIASDSTLLLPLLRNNGQAMGELGDQAAELGGILSTETITAGIELQDNLRELDLAFKGLRAEVAAGAIPVLMDLTETLRDLARDGDVSEIMENIGAGFNFVVGTAKVVSSTVRGLVFDLIALANAGQAAFDVLTFDFEGAAKNMGEAGIAREMAAAESADIGRVFAGGSGEADRPEVIFAGQGREPVGLFKRTRESVLNETADPVAPAATVAKTKAVKELTEAEKAYQDVMETNALIDEMTARHQTDLTIAAGDRMVAEDEANKARREAFEQQLGDMQFELDLLGMTNKERERAIALRYANVDAASAEGQAILDMSDALFEAREQAALLDDVKDGLKDMFVDFVSGAKSAKEAFGDFADMLFARALEFVADQAIQAMFDAFSGKGAAGGGSSGGGAGWGGVFSNILGAFAGGKASGGDVMASRRYLVGEEGPEMFVPRTAGTILPASQTAAMAGGGGAFSQTLQFALAAPTDPRTQQQIAQRVGFETQRASNRNR